MSKTVMKEVSPIAKRAVPFVLAHEAAEMIGKATTMTANEMDAEKKQKLNQAIDQMIGGKGERGSAVMDGMKQVYGLTIANGVQRANQALETVREDAQTNKAYAIAKGVVNVPARIVQGLTLDTMKEVAETAIHKLPDLVENRMKSGPMISREMDKNRGGIEN